MKQQTELMRHILQNEMSQRIIDMVSNLYGESYVGLWIYEAIGTVLGEVYRIAEQLRYETNPMTTELLMSYWEEHYGLPPDSSMTMEERRARLLDKIRYRAPANPKRLAESMAIVLGVPVSITERVAKNTFRVEIQDSVSDFRKMRQALSVLDSRKPAHLIYEVNVNSRVDETHLKLATAATQKEQYHVDVQAIKLTLQTTLEKAIKMGAAVSIGEQYFINPESIAIETRANLEQRMQMATMVTNSEEYNVETIKSVARSAVETAFKIASPVFANEEYIIKEVNTP